MPVQEMTLSLPESRSPSPSTWWVRAWQPFWVLPMLLVTACFLLGVLLPLFDDAVAWYLPLGFTAGPEGARSVLGAVAAATVSVVGVVFSTTLVVVQLASSQFSPLVLQTFLHLRMSKVTLGIFLGTFVYSLTVLRTIRSNDLTFVPQVSLLVAFLLTLACVVCFVAFIHHVTTSVQVSWIIGYLGDVARRVLDRQLEPAGDGPEEYPVVQAEPWDGQAPQEARLVRASVRGVVGSIRLNELMSQAVTAGGTLYVLAQVGQFCPSGTPLVAWVPEAGESHDGGPVEGPDEDRLRAAFELRGTRTNEFDPAYVLRQVSDICVRALSPGTNDPTTAVQGVNEIHEVLRQAVQRRDLAPFFKDDDGVARLWWRPQTVSQLLSVGLDGPIHHGAEVPDVRRVLLETLDDLLQVARPEHQEAVKELLRGMGGTRQEIDPAQAF